MHPHEDHNNDSTGAQREHAGHDAPPDQGHAGHEAAAMEDHSAHASAANHSGHGGGQQGHDKHAGHDPDAFKRLFWVSLVLSIPVIAFSEMVQDWFGYSLDRIPGDGLVSPVLGVIVFLVGGRIFLRGGWDEIRSRQPGMMLLISLAIGVAFVASVASELGLMDLEFWWELSALITVMLLGHWQEMKALGQTRSALASLAALLPDEAERMEDGNPVTVSAADLREDDIVLVRPGARVPGDGVIVEGRAELDESMLTGESRPVAREEGEDVAAGTVVHGAAIQVRITAVGETTAIAGIQRMVADAQSSRSRAQAIADRAASWLFFIAIAVGAITFAAWNLLGDPNAAVIRTVTVLVIACPHALGLAIPLVIAISTEVSAKSGILVKDRLSLERMRTIDMVVFDKTGTLTKGTPAVTGAWAADGDEARVLALAGSVENVSEHPLARAIVARAKEEGAGLPSARDFTSDAGRGVRATVDGSEVQVGGPQLLRSLSLDEPGRPDIEAWRERGATVLYVIRDGDIIGAIALEDEVRPESHDAIEQLHAAGIRVAMVTGDASSVAHAVAEQLNIDEVFAEVLPEDKARKVIELQDRGLRVAMVGDGVNDAPALAQADVGVAIGAGTDVAIDSAGVVLASDNPAGVLAIVRLSRAAYRKMVQNLFWAAGYNVVAIPLAAGAFAFAGLVMPPAVGALLMSLSTVIVAANAQLLRRAELYPSNEAAMAQ